MALGLGVAGCGSSGSSSSDGPRDAAADGPAPPCDGGCWKPTSDDLVFIDSFCALTRTCCNSFRSTPVSPTSCNMNLRQGGPSRDPALRAACIKELQSIASMPACLPSVLDASDPCVRIGNEPSGPIPAGGQGCTSNADCAGAPGTYTFCVVRLCMQVTAGKAGDGPCLGNMDVNGIINSSPFIGLTVNPVGVVCRASDGLYCRASDTVAGTVCVPLDADGAPCGSERFCASGSCDTVGVPGGACRPAAPLGSSCATSPCAPGSYCDNTQTCAPPQSAGATCRDDQGCASHFCGNVCMPVSFGSELGFCGF